MPQTIPSNTSQSFRVLPLFSAWPRRLAGLVACGCLAACSGAGDNPDFGATAGGDATGPTTGTSVSSSAAGTGGSNGTSSGGASGAATAVTTGSSVVTSTSATTASGAGGSSTAASGAGGSGAGGSGSGGAVPAGTPVATHGQLKVVGPVLQDQAGKPVQLKGVSSMWLNWESKPFAESKASLQYMRDNWKLSVVRAAMGVEASGGYLSSAANKTAMLAKVDTIVQNAIDLGVYVIIDWHTGTANTQQADAVAFFTAMAQKYGSYPNVIYEPFNEPAPKVTWATIKPYHEAVVAAIRAVDPDNLIVMGTPNYSQDVDVAAADPVAGTNLLYTLHFYACSHKQSLRDKGSAAIALGAALFITEFGATPADGGVVKNGDNNICEAETNNWFSWMSTNNISGSAWKLEQCTDSSCILTATAPVDGPWTDDVLTTDANDPVVTGGVQGGGHGLFIVNWLRE